MAIINIPCFDLVIVLLPFILRFYKYVFQDTTVYHLQQLSAHTVINWKSNQEKGFVFLNPRIKHFQLVNVHPTY